MPETEYRDVLWLGAGPNPRSTEVLAPFGVAFLLVTFLWRDKEKSLAVLYRDVRISREAGAGSDGSTTHKFIDYIDNRADRRDN